MAEDSGRNPTHEHVDPDEDEAFDELSVEELEDVAGGAEIMDNTGCTNIFCCGDGEV